MSCGGAGLCDGTTMSSCGNLEDCGVTSDSCWSKCRKDHTYTCSIGVCGTFHDYITASQGERCENGKENL